MRRNQSTLDGEAARGSERLGYLAHEMRNLMQTALLAFDVLKRGDVGVGGSTGLVLHRSLIAARDLVGRSLAEARLTQGIEHRERFTRPHTTVTLRVVATADRVRVEIEDECGGLPEVALDDLFRPYIQHGTDRTGLGLGLAFSRWAAEANGGQLFVQNLPGKGCNFIATFPRVVAVPV